METQLFAVNCESDWLVIELPIRDGNNKMANYPTYHHRVIELPIRDGNLLGSLVLSINKNELLNFL